MNERQAQLLAEVQELWAQAEKAQNFQALGLYQTALGKLNNALKMATDADAYGFGARFCYFATYFYATKANNQQEAQRIFNLCLQNIRSALQLDPNQFDANYITALNAADQLGDVPQGFTQALLTGNQGGSMWNKLFQTGFDKGRFNEARQNFFKSVATTLDAFSHKTGQNCFIEDAIAWMNDLLGLTDIVATYQFDMSEVLRTVANAPGYEAYHYYSADEQASQLVQQYESLKQNALDRLAAFT
jgi:hypothetical protein